MVDNYVYRSMNDYQLQSICDKIESSLKDSPSDGMKKELELAKGVLEERGMQLAEK